MRPGVVLSSLSDRRYLTDDRGVLTQRCHTDSKLINSGSCRRRDGRRATGSVQHRPVHRQMRENSGSLRSLKIDRRGTADASAGDLRPWTFAFRTQLGARSSTGAGQKSALGFGDH